MPTRQQISSGSAFESQIAYSRAVVCPPWVFVSGTTGYDYATGHLPASAPDQADQAMRNIDAALRQAGSSVADVVRVRYVLPDRHDFPAIWPVLRRWFGSVRPAATMVQAGLMEEAMKVEIEVTARIGSGDGDAGGQGRDCSGLQGGEDPGTDAPA
jgi:enamine deaminase RidA (YjgF/YER057c/UK114 family)